MHAGDFQRRLLQQVAHLSFNLVAHKHKAPFLSSLQDGNASTKCKSCIEVRALVQQLAVRSLHLWKGPKDTDTS